MSAATISNQGSTAKNNAEVRDPEILETMPTAGFQEEAVDAKMRQKLILKAVDELPPKMRKVIILYEFGGIEPGTNCAKTGVPAGTVKSRLFNARQILKQKLSYLKGE